MMKIEETKSSPYIYFDENKGFLNIIGVSLSDNVYDFYFHLDEKILRYNKDYLKMDFHFKYLNSPSIKKIFTIIKYCSEKIKKISINWIYDYEDEDIKEIGEEFEYLLKIKFNFIVKY